MTTTIKQHINSLPLDERADFVKDYNELQAELKQLNNMTKVSVFGQEPAEQPKELKKIEFVKYIHNDGLILEAEETQSPENWDNVKLFDFKDDEQFDTILAWDDDQKSKCIFLGHWNDGVI